MVSGELIIGIITALGGGGLVQALISWARGRRSDDADVAERWERLATTSLDGAERRIASLNEDVARLAIDLDNARDKARELVIVLEDALREMDRHNLNTADYRERLRLIT